SDVGALACSCAWSCACGGAATRAGAAAIAAASRLMRIPDFIARTPRMRRAPRWSPCCRIPTEPALTGVNPPSDPREHQARVGAAEAEAVGHHGRELRLAAFAQDREAF